MFGFAYASKENGAVFSHMAVMYAYALYSKGFPEAGWKVVQQLLRQCMAFSKSRILPGIPEYFDDRGQGMYPYLTGAGSWMLLTMQTQVFGARGEEGALTLEPKLLRCQFDRSGSAEITCNAVGRCFQVRYENPHGLEPWDYQIGRVQIGDAIFPCGQTKFTLPSAQLPAGQCLKIIVSLEPKKGEK